MTGHPSVVDLLDRQHEQDVQAHLQRCPTCTARTRLLDISAPPEGLEQARVALAEARAQASFTLNRTLTGDPLTEEEDLEVGRRIDRYLVKGRIGWGGMGAVYEVEHTQLGSRHALKVLHRASDSVRERLMREGQAQSRLQHENVVPVTDVIDVDGSPGLIMALVDGPAMSRWLKDQGPPPLDVVARLGEQIIRAVAAAHGAGIVHRDLKPGNVLIATTDQGPTARVCDFGLARWDEHEEVGAGPMGTPGYMAPEQIRDASQAEFRSDVFSLGAVLYELATGRRAFDGPTVHDVWDHIQRGEYLAPEQVRPELPASMVTTIHRALEVDVDARFADCGDLLSSWRARPATPQPAPISPPAAIPAWAAVGLAAAGLIAASSALVWATRPRPEPAPAVVTATPPGHDGGDRRLTAVGESQQIFAVDLSNDDQSLLFTDGRGLWHQPTKAGTPRLVVDGGMLQSVDWFADGERALVSGTIDDEEGTWVVNISNGFLTEAGSRPLGYLTRLSPDETRVATLTKDGLYVSDLEGGEPKRVMAIPEDGGRTGALCWSPDGAHLALVQRNLEDATPFLVRVDASTGESVVLMRDPRLMVLGLSAIEWMAPDRLLFALGHGKQTRGSLMALDGASTAVDTHAARTLRTWKDYALIRMRAGTEGLVASRGTARLQAWQLDPDAPASFARMTTEAWEDRPLGWTRDGLIFTSNRGGGGVFRQAPDGTVTSIAADKSFPLHASMAAGGLVWGRLTREEAEGAPPVLEVRREEPDGPRLLLDRPLPDLRPGTMPVESVRCAADRCLVSFTEDDAVAFHWLDPKTGAASDVVARTGRAARTRTWTLSPDAKQLLVLLSEPGARIDVDLATGAQTETPIDLMMPLAVEWSPDAVYVSGVSFHSAKPYRIARLAADGSTEVLRSSETDNFAALYASPDGEQLAVGVHAYGTDVWLLDL